MAHLTCKLHNRRSGVHEVPVDFNSPELGMEVKVFHRTGEACETDMLMYRGSEWTPGAVLRSNGLSIDHVGMPMKTAAVQMGIDPDIFKKANRGKRGVEGRK